MTDDEDTTPPEHLAGLSGMDLVRRALEEARAAARGQGKQVGQGRRSPAARRAAAAEPHRSRAQRRQRRTRLRRPGARQERAPPLASSSRRFTAQHQSPPL